MLIAFLSKEKFFKRLSKENYESYIQKFPQKCILLQKTKWSIYDKRCLTFEKISGNQYKHYERSTPVRLMKIINMLYEGCSIDTVHKSLCLALLGPTFDPRGELHVY